MFFCSSSTAVHDHVRVTQLCYRHCQSADTLILIEFVACDINQLEMTSDAMASLCASQQELRTKHRNIHSGLI